MTQITLAVSGSISAYKAADITHDRCSDRIYHTADLASLVAKASCN